MTTSTFTISILFVVLLSFFAGFFSGQLINNKHTYKTFMAGESKMVRLPSGTSINIEMTKEDAMYLIANPRSGISAHMAKEITDYFSRRDNKTITSGGRVIVGCYYDSQDDFDCGIYFEPEH